MSGTRLVVGLLAVLLLVGCTPSTPVTAPATQQTLQAAVSSLEWSGPAGRPEFIGASARESADATVAVLYFVSSSHGAFNLAEDVAVLVTELGKTRLPELRKGFDLVATDRGGTAGVRLTFDAETVTRTGWDALQDQFTTVNFPLVFDKAASYEWQSGSDWISTTRSPYPATKAELEYGTYDGRFPLQQDFPRARFDAPAIRRLVSELEYAEPAGPSLNASVSISGADSFKRVEITLDTAQDAAGYVVAAEGSYILGRLSKDPSITVVELRIRQHGAETCALLFTHEGIAGRDWGSFQVYSTRAPFEVFRLANAYRWTSEAAWREELEADGLAAEQFPRMNQADRLP